MVDDGLFPEDTLEHVPLPFFRQQPKYRREVEVTVRGYITFSTWEDPDVWLEDDDNIDGPIDHLLTWDAGADMNVDYPYRTDVEMQNEDGTWGPVDWHRIEMHKEDQQPDTPDTTTH